jgi:hypothetical protein
MFVLPTPQSPIIISFSGYSAECLFYISMYGIIIWKRFSLAVRIKNMRIDLIKDERACS